jgi:hypothetical protein
MGECSPAERTGALPGLNKATLVASLSRRTASGATLAPERNESLLLPRNLLSQQRLDPVYARAVTRDEVRQ